jgi:addiction module HigA family antidote
MAGKLLDPIHPGEILAEEFMAPYGLSANGLAGALGVPVTRISEIVRGRRGITADSALRLARYFGTSAELWLGLQAEYDLRVAQRKAGREIRRRVPAARRLASGQTRPRLPRGGSSPAGAVGTSGSPRAARAVRRGAGGALRPIRRPRSAGG